MANDEHVAIVRQGANAIAEYRRRYPAVRFELSFANLSFEGLVNADLSGADLECADLSGANLECADLSDAKLIDANLSDANLSDAKLSGADLAYANLAYANLAYANLAYAHLSSAHLSNAELSNAELSNANLQFSVFRNVRLRETNFAKTYFGGTTFATTDLRGAKGLESVVHLGPSELGIQTIEMSRGQIPREFLEGCGISDAWITYFPSLIGTPFELCSCFISHSTVDAEFCTELHDQLKGRGVKTWYAPHDGEYGKKLLPQIWSAIEVHDKLMIVLSDASIKSDWVAVEILKARKREREQNRQILYPIMICSYSRLKKWRLLDPETGEDVAQEIREFLIADFSDWQNPESFAGVFDRLVKGLRAEQV